MSKFKDFFGLACFICNNQIICDTSGPPNPHRKPYRYWLKNDCTSSHNIFEKLSFNHPIKVNVKENLLSLHQVLCIILFPYFSSELERLQREHRQNNLDHEQSMAQNDLKMRKIVAELERKEKELRATTKELHK